MPPDRSGVERSHEKPSAPVTLYYCLRPLPISDSIISSTGGSISRLPPLPVLLPSLKKTLISKEALPATYFWCHNPRSCSARQKLWAPHTASPPQPQTSIVSELQKLTLFPLALPLDFLYT